MPKVDLVFFEAGGGHRAASEALELVIQRQQSWPTRPVNLQELLDPLDVIRKLTGVRVQDAYNLMLRKNWTLGAARLLPLLHGLIRRRHPETVRLLEHFWHESPPDLVVSLVPNFNRALFEGLQRAAPRAPFVTVLTDLADYPPHFWMEAQDQYFICGTARAAEQARALGTREDRIYRTSGMILHPRFYEPLTLDRDAERQRLGLDPRLPTGLVLFGGQGSEVMKDIVRRLDGSTRGKRGLLELQLILICGHNRRLEATLKDRAKRLRCSIVGYTKEIPYYMALADFFIGKPGPGSISEALAMNLPVIVERNAWTLPQERFNADWILEKQVGIVLDRAIEDILCPEHLARYRANAAALENRAVFEIIPVLKEILEKH